MNRGQEASTVWALGAGHPPSSFLIPGPVGVAGARCSSTAVAAPSSHRRVGNRGLLPSGPTPAWALLTTSCSHRGPRGRVTLGAVRTGAKRTHQAQHTALLCPGRAHLEAGSMGARLGAARGTRRRTGLFDRWFRPMPGCRAAGSGQTGPAACLPALGRNATCVLCVVTAALGRASEKKSPRGHWDPTPPDTAREPEGPAARPWLS